MKYFNLQSSVDRPPTHTRTRFLRGYRFESSWTLKIFLSAPSNDMAIINSF